MYTAEIGGAWVWLIVFLSILQKVAVTADFLPRSQGRWQFSSVVTWS